MIAVAQIASVVSTHGIATIRAMPSDPTSIESPIEAVTFGSTLKELA